MKTAVICGLTGTRKAINEFAQKYHIGFMPIGDTLSIAFVKN